MVKQTNDGPKIQLEKKTVSAMIAIYYKPFKDTKKQQEKEQVISYAMSRLDSCQFGEEKPTCKVCPVHCYKKSYQEKMKVIMRYSGPRMLFYHPILSIEHFIKEWRYKKGRMSSK